MIRQETASDFDYCEVGRRASLGSPTSAKENLYCAPTFGGFIEITISHPESIQWNKMNSDRQKRKLSEMFRYACAAIPLSYHEESERYFEYNSHGVVHLHGYLKLNETLRCYPIGVVSDISKVIVSLNPKKYSKFCSAHLCGKWCRYRSPQCVVQYRDGTDEVRIKSWKDYCLKLQ